MSNTSQIAPVMGHASTSDVQMIGVDEVDRRLAETCDNDEIINIITELEAAKRQLNAERLRVAELEDQLSSLSMSTEILLFKWPYFFLIINVFYIHFSSR